jgi:streptomycin 6-kinase
MEPPTSKNLGRRVENRISVWRIVVEHVEETESSILAFGQRGNQQVVLKVIRNRRDEWRPAEMLDAFQGNGVVRVYDYVEGALSTLSALVSRSISMSVATAEVGA